MKPLISAVLLCALAACGDNGVTPMCPDGVCETCGNGTIDPGEDCDGTDLGTATCLTEGQAGGKLACNASCQLDTTGCTAASCGNGVVEAGEECDGADLGGATCASSGFSAGTLGCNANCELDLAPCCNNFCSIANTSLCSGETVQTCTMQANGCLAPMVTDCEMNDDVCVETGGVASCVCVDRCAAEGLERCGGSTTETCIEGADGCLAWVAGTDCGATGQACAVGPQGATCVAPATGENCADPYPITEGDNLVAWSAATAEYVTFDQSCNNATLAGPDIVLQYTATVDGIVTYELDKVASARHVVVVTSGTCGTITNLNEVSCVADTPPTTLSDTFAVTAGTTYNFYLRDTTTNAATLPSPLSVSLNEEACATLSNPGTNLSPTNGAVITTASPVMSVDFPHPVRTNVGVITVTGDLGTTRSYDLSATPAPTQVTFTNNGRTMSINPSVAFVPGEQISISWTGLVDEFCGAAIVPPVWTFELLTPSCRPGMGGMVGSTATRVTSTLPSGLTEYTVMADTSPTGYVYVGGLSDLYRVPKTGGSFQDVGATGGVTATHLGYSGAIVGSQIFTLDTATVTTSPFLYRLSTSSGLTWNPLGFASYPMAAGGSGYGLAHHEGRLYVIGNETTVGQPTQIWSVPANAVSLPQTAVLEGTFAEHECNGLAVDDRYIYATCDDDFGRLVRVDRTTWQSELITTAIPLSATKNDLHLDDFNADGLADALYVKGEDETVRYVCGPAAAGPFWQDVLVDFGGAATTANYGLGFDPVGNVLWAYDDDTQELISIR